MPTPIGTPDPVRFSGLTLSGCGGGGFDLEGTTSMIAGEKDVFNAVTGGGRVGFLFTSKERGSIPQEIVLGYRFIRSSQKGIDPSELFQKLGFDPDREVSITDFVDLDQIPEPYRTQIEEGSTPVTLQDLLLADAGVPVSATHTYHTGEILWRLHVGGFAVGNWFALQPRIAAGLSLGAHTVVFSRAEKETSRKTAFAPAVRFEGGVVAMFNINQSFGLGLSTTIAASIGVPTYVGGDLSAEAIIRW